MCKEMETSSPAHSQLSEDHEMQSIRLAKQLLLLAAAINAGRSAAQEFAAVAASPYCAASILTVNARSDIECAVKCSQISGSLSYSFISGVCVLSDRPDCAQSGATSVFRKRQLDTPNSEFLGVEQQIDRRRFWVFQQRQTGQVAFNRTWADYEKGFGNSTEFWSGLLEIYAFTRSHNNTLRIEITTVDGKFYAGEWLNFVVGDSSGNYRMNCGDYITESSNITDDAIKSHRGMQFSTIDRCNPYCVYNFSFVAAFGNGGFWFPNDQQVSLNPNGLYSLTNTGSFSYIWCKVVEGGKALRAIRMMLQI